VSRHRRHIAEREVHPIGLGGMPMSLEGRPDEAQSIRTIHAALAAGCELFDTADVYAIDESELGHNERLLAKALRGHRDEVILATKGGLTRRGRDWPHDASPEHLRAACEASLARLETDRIDLYQLHRPDQSVPFAESVGALRDLQAEGKIRWVGLSNVHVAQLEEALAIVEVVSVQNELSLRYTDPIAKGEVAACEDRGIAFLAWSPQQVALAWLLSLGETVIPIPGARRPETIRDSLAASELELSPAEAEEISAAVR
jgi:aryl-alcohol dehydrogenase-like predicted oxidoreductase